MNDRFDDFTDICSDGGDSESFDCNAALLFGDYDAHSTRDTNTSWKGMIQDKSGSWTTSGSS